jgi:uncharacterized membrane-anchored protein YhcB (DUF1043 family)
MNERDRDKDRLEQITDPPPPPRPRPAPPGKKDPCAEITAKLEAKRNELEEKQAEIEKLTAESLRTAGLDDVLTPKDFKHLQKLHSLNSVKELLERLKDNEVPVRDFKSWVKAGMPEESNEEEHKKVWLAIQEPL